MNKSVVPIRNKHVDHYIKRITSFLKGAAGSNRGEIQKWLFDDGRQLKRAYSALKKEQEICTIMHSQSPQKLNTFFYVPKVVYRNNKSEAIEPMSIISSDGEVGSGVLVSGRLGQGKSMLLRYLQFLELNSGSTIPIFMDLQKIKSGGFIFESAKDKMNSLGFECSTKLFDFLFSRGYITLFLDGYDEIQFDKRDSFNVEITNVINKVSGRKVFITSRHDTEIERLPGIVGYEIEPLGKDDHPKFIKKIINDEAETINIIKKIGEAREFDPTVLDTPLLLTWFIMVYKVRRKIPKTKIGFYEELFKTILSRHDGIKGSLDRPSKSGLTDDEIEMILHAFCYVTSKNDESDFDEKNIIDRITQAINIVKIKNVKAAEFLYDLTHITCLLVKDGMTYSFIHDSIQSYFSACFVKETNDENASKFYKNSNMKWRQWGDELNFLFYLDRYRFHKYMIMPSIVELSGTEAEVIADRKKLDSLGFDVIKRIYSNACVLYVPIEDGEFRYFSSFYLPTVSFTCHFIFNGGDYNPKIEIKNHTVNNRN